MSTEWLDGEVNRLRARLEETQQARDRYADERDQARRHLHDANNRITGLLLSIDEIAEIGRQVREPFAGMTAIDLLDRIDAIVALCRP